MRAFGRHVVMNSVTGVILSNHGFAVSFNNVSACRYSRGVVSRQFSRSPRESNQISPPKYYSPHRLRSFFEREYKLEREDTIFVWRDEISISKRRGAEHFPHPPSPDLIYDVCFSTATRIIVNGTRAGPFYPSNHWNISCMVFASRGQRSER